MARVRHQDGRLEEACDKAKTWKGHYYVYDSDGTRHHRSVNLGPRSRKNKTDAKKELRIIIERETKVVRSATGEDTFEWFWKQRFLPNQKWSNKTRTVAEIIIRKHVLPVLGHLKLRDIDRHRLQLLMQSLAPYSKSMSKLVRHYISKTMEEALEQDLIPKNPARKVTMVTTMRPCKRYLTMKEIDNLLAEMNTRDRLICRIAIVLGLRPAELFGLKWDDFDEANHQLRIDETYDSGQWKDTKTEGSNGWVSMPPTIGRQIAAWREETSGPYIFSNSNGNPVDRADFLKRCILEAALRAGIVQPRPKGLPKGAKWQDKKTAVNFQAFRRTCATWCQKDGSLKDVQAHLRHVSPATTMEHYIQEIPASTRHAVESLDARLFGSQPVKQVSEMTQ